MSVEALGLALVSTVRPTTAAVVWAMLVGDRPRRLLGAYLIAGMTVSLTVGVVVVLLLGGVFPTSAGGRAILLIALGLVALLGAAAERFGWLRRFRSARTATARPRRLSPAGAAVAGVLTHLPGVFYLAGLGAIVASGAAAGAATAQVIAYNLVWFSPALVALGVSLSGAGPPGDRLVEIAARVRAHQETLLTVCFGGVGVWLIAEGVVALA